MGRILNGFTRVVEVIYFVWQLFFFIRLVTFVKGHNADADRKSYKKKINVPTLKKKLYYKQ